MRYTVVKIAFLSISFMGTWASFAEGSCSNTVSAIESDQDLEQLEVFEGKLQEYYFLVYAEIKNIPDRRDRFDGVLQALSDMGVLVERLSDTALAEELVDLGPLARAFSKIEVDFIEARSQIYRRDESKLPEPEVSIDSLWERVVISPSSIVAGREYLVPINNGPKVSVAFSQEVIDKLFTSASLQRPAIKVLKTIQKGLKGSDYVGDGMKRLRLDREVIEVSFKSRSFGTVRIGGYLKGGVFHFGVFFNSGGHHQGNYIVRFRDSVRRFSTHQGH